MLRIVTAGAALFFAGANLAQAGVLDFLLGTPDGEGSGVVPASATTCSTCPDYGGPGCTAGSGSCECYGGHLPCCADARGCRDRWRLWFTKKCRCLHHHTFYPPVAPLFHPTWGYHQTCWRQFPPLPPCPPADAWLMHGAACPAPIQPAPLPAGSPRDLAEPGFEPPAPATPEYDPESTPPAPFEDVPGATPAPGSQSPPLDEPAPGAAADELGLFELPTDRTSRR